MTKKERIAKLEKELEELKQRIVMLELDKLAGKETKNPWVWPNPEPIPTYPYTPPAYPFGYPIITWNDTTADLSFQ